MINSIAALKRALQPGALLTLVQHDWYPNSFMVGQAREVVESDSVKMGLRTERPDGTTVVSYLRWPKASEITFTPGGFEVVMDDGGNRMVYRIDQASLNTVG